MHFTKSGNNSEILISDVLSSYRPVLLIVIKLSLPLRFSYFCMLANTVLFWNRYL